ncbi:MAG TPA: PadR family transcriptional regulator [Candidatus Dormibacteraeota bacterium]|jgi:DNA-binding PadR family transcriptional regulator
MTEVSTELSPLALSILELLDERPMHPYELAATMRDRHHDEFIRLNFGSLYHTVEALERDGWIVPVEREKEGRRPERTVYGLTDAGRSLLLRVIGETLATPRREYPYFAAGLMFMHHLSAAEAAEHLGRRAVALAAVADKLNRIMTALLDDGVKRLSIIELEHKIAMLEAERAWVLDLEREISGGSLEWKAGIVSGQAGLRRRNGTSSNAS